MLYAIFESGSKQYKATIGTKIKVETFDAGVGDKIHLKDIIMIADNENYIIGRPTVENATIEATVLSIGRHKKVQIFKMKRRKHHQKHQGHRQNYLELVIDSISYKE